MRLTTTRHNGFVSRDTRCLLLGLTLFTPWLANCRDAHAVAITWNVAGGGVWDTTTPNWTGGSTVFTNGDDVTFNNTAGGVINLTADRAPLSTTFSAASGTYTISGSNITNGTLALSGAGTVVLNSQWTTPSSSVTIGGGGTLRLGASDRLADTVNLLGNGTFDMNGFNETITTLNGGYSIINMGILTVKSGFDRSGGFIGGVGGRFVNDTGANFGVILNAGGHTYSGGTEVKTGTMYLYGTDNVLPMTGELEVKTGATMSLNYHQNPGITQTIGILVGGGSIKSGNTNAASADTLLRVGNGGGSSTFSGVFSGFGKLEKIGAGTLTLDGNNTYTGTTTVTGGTLRVNGTTGAGQGVTVHAPGSRVGHLLPLRCA